MTIYVEIETLIDLKILVLTIIRNEYVYKHNILYLSKYWSDSINPHPKFKLTNRMQSHEHTVMVLVRLLCLLSPLSEIRQNFLIPTDFPPKIKPVGKDK